MVVEVDAYRAGTPVELGAIALGVESTRGVATASKDLIR